MLLEMKLHQGRLVSSGKPTKSPCYFSKEGISLGYAGKLAYTRVGVHSCLSSGSLKMPGLPDGGARGEGAQPGHTSELSQGRNISPQLCKQLGLPLSLGK